MRIRRKFLQLTKQTYPFGTESSLRSYLPQGHQVDKFGNYFLLIGETPSTMFTCHLDTACGKQQKVKHVQNGNIISTDGQTILGADDKAGMVVLLYMIEKKIPGLYYFFLGEEVGCVGSGKVAGEWLENELSKTITKVVSFDRRGQNSVITEQWMGQCCSLEFANELAKRLNSSGFGLSLKPDDTGIFTDSAKFMNLVPECTNISVGYGLEHTHKEFQDIEYLGRLCAAVCKIDWETLPIKRDQYDVDFDDDFDDDDEELEFTSKYFSYFSIGNITKKMYIAKSLIRKESKILGDWIVNEGWSDAKTIIWNGHSLNVETESGNSQFIGNRHELSELVPELGEVSLDYLSDKILL